MYIEKKSSNKEVKRMYELVRLNDGSEGIIVEQSDSECMVETFALPDHWNMVLVDNSDIAEVIHAVSASAEPREITEYDGYRIDMPYVGKKLSEDELIVFLRRKQLAKKAATLILEDLR